MVHKKPVLDFLVDYSQTGLIFISFICINLKKLETMVDRSFSELVTGLQVTANEVISLAKDSDVQIEASTEFPYFIKKLIQILGVLKENEQMDTPSIGKVAESLETELRRAKTLIGKRTIHISSQAKQVEDVTHNLGRSLGLLLFATHDSSFDCKESIEALCKEMMNSKFAASSDCESVSQFTDEVETEETEGDIVIEKDQITLDVEDIVLQLKCGNDEELKYAIWGLSSLIAEKKISSDWIDDEDIISILFNRLGSSKPRERIIIIQILRSLVTVNNENMERMADVGLLSTLVKSLARDMEEQREAVGLLLSLSDISTVSRRLGKLQGCIVMLVAILNGEDQVASCDAGKLLNALSSNTQNALHMAEAGYFKPLAKYLKKGSDMSKILMATALSRMELTDQSRTSLGEDGAIESLVKMFNTGNLEAKLSALNALQNLSSLKENIQRMVKTGIVQGLLQLLFSVTSVLMTLREPASAILARIAESESILVNQGVAQQMLSLLNLCSPVIQDNLLRALNSIAAHSGASKLRKKMNNNGAVQLLLPFLSETKTSIRTGALKLICTLSKDLSGELTEQLGERHITGIVNIIALSVSESEKAAAIGLLSNLPVTEKKATEILKRDNLLPLLVCIISSTSIASMSTPAMLQLAESIAGIFIRFTVSSDKRLQLYAVELGVIPILLKLLSNESLIAKRRAAISLAQLSQNTLALRKFRSASWFCIPPSSDAICEVHDGYCSMKNTFCLVKAGAVPLLIKILESNEREADEGALAALSTILQDEIWENGSNYIVKLAGVEAILKVLESGAVKAQERALWMLERIFRVEAHRVRYCESAQGVLIDLAQKGDQRLKPITAKLLAQLELLQVQSSYF